MTRFTSKALSGDHFFLKHEINKLLENRHKCLARNLLKQQKAFTGQHKNIHKMWRLTLFSFKFSSSTPGETVDKAQNISDSTTSRTTCPKCDNCCTCTEHKKQLKTNFNNTTCATTNAQAVRACCHRWRNPPVHATTIKGLNGSQLGENLLRNNLNFLNLKH